MDIALFIIGCVACLCIVIASVVIMHPRIHEGLLIKAGLITLAVGSFALINHVTDLAGAPAMLGAEVRPLVRAVAACSGGVVMVLSGLIWRIWSSPVARGAALMVTGWAGLDDEPANGRE